MNILSFMYGDGCHDTSAAIVCEGRLVAAAEEERFSRNKHERGFPAQAIAYCLKEAGLRMSQVDILAFPELPYWTGPDSYYLDMEWSDLRALYTSRNGRRAATLRKRLATLLNTVGLRARFHMEPHCAEGFGLLRQHFEGRPKSVRFYDHHRCHAAAAYFGSGAPRAAVVTTDFNGGPYSTVTWRGEGKSLTRLRAATYLNSLGIFYLHCTEYLGLGDYGEGKAMGLAPYGDARVFASILAEVLDTDSADWYRVRATPSPRILGFAARTNQDIMASPYPDFAAAFQAKLERAVYRVAAAAIKEAGTRTLCLGGGVGLNCSSNGSLLRTGISDSLWMFPASNDAGLPVGAALLAAVDAGESRREVLDHAYWGPSFSRDYCETAVRRETRIHCRRLSAPASEIAERLSQGKIIGWFHGRMEIGPRALGHRSILADPRSTDIRDRVNRLKARESWRPLAPVVVADRADEYFDLPAPSPFMLMACPVRPDVRAKIPGVVHVDGSARPQTVTKEQNAGMHELLLAFEHRAGVPVLLNTSFNTAGEPVVCTPEDAIETFLRAGLDALVLEDLLITRIGAQ